MECLSADTVVDLLERQRPEADAALVDEHLRGCLSCRELLAEVARSYSPEATALSPLGAPALTASPDVTAPSRSDETGPAEPTRIGRYQLLHRVGAGGMGVVYAAYDSELDRKVALKLLRRDVRLPLAQTDLQSRLLREAQVMGRLTHPNVISVYDAGVFEARVFFVMELIAGRTVGAWLQTPRPWAEVLEVMISAGHGLAAAHAAGLVHRDFKPDNILLSDDGRVLITDFGLARPSAPVVEEATVAKPGGPVAGRVHDPLTQPGTLAGTPAFMSPEQLRGEPADARSDQFAFCVALYQGLYGERPFGGDSLQALSEAVAQGRIRPAPDHVRVPSWLRTLVVRGLAANPGVRFESMEALLRELDPSRRRRTRLLLASAGVVLSILALGLAGGWWRARASVCDGAAAQLSGVWDFESKATGRRAFEATGVPYALDTWRRVERLLDGYADRWVVSTTDNCEATRFRNEQPEELMALRTQCLSRGRDELDSLVRLFQRADGKLVGSAVQAAGQLVPSEQCADRERLRALTPLPPEAAVRGEVAALRSRIAEVTALERTGQLARGIALGAEVVADARKIAYRPVEAEALLAYAQVRSEVGDFADGIRLFHQAVSVAEAAGYDQVKGEALIALIYFEYSRGDVEEATRIVELAQAVVDRSGLKATLEHRLLVNEASLLSARGQYPEALAKNLRALALRQQEVPVNELAISVSLNNTALAFNDLGQFDEATEHLGRALALIENVLGPDHPETARTRSNVGLLYLVQGDFEKALAALRQSLESLERSEAVQSHVGQMALEGLSRTCASAGRYAEALKFAERAVATGLKVHGGARADVPFLKLHVARAQLGLGARAEALKELAEAASNMEHDADALEVSRANYLRLSAELTLRAGGEPPPRERLQAGLGMMQKLVGEGNEETGRWWLLIGDVHGHSGRWSEARDAHRQGVAILEALLGTRPGMVEPLFQVATSELKLGRPAEAIGLLERALAIAEHNVVDPALSGAVRFGLARSLWESQRDRGRALVLARQAQATLEAASEAARGDRKEVAAWLARHDH